jgi:hypothetical protein
MESIQFIILYSIFTTITIYYIFLHSSYFYERSTGVGFSDSIKYYLPYAIIVLICFSFYFNDDLSKYMNYGIILILITAIIFLSINFRSLMYPGINNYYWFNNGIPTGKTWKQLTISQKNFASVYPEKMDTKLVNLQFCSSYHSPVFTNRFFSNKVIVSPSAIIGVINKGARFLHMDVFGDSVIYGADPVVGVAREYPNDLLSINTIPFGEACDAILQARNGNSTCPGIPGDDYGGTDGPKDPIFIYLRLKTGKRPLMEEKIAEIIEDRFSDYLSGIHYTENLSLQEFHKVAGKILIITDREPDTDSMRNLTNGVACGKNLSEFTRRRGDDPNQLTPDCRITTSNISQDRTMIEALNFSQLEGSGIVNTYNTVNVRNSAETNTTNEVDRGYKNMTIVMPNQYMSEDLNSDEISNAIKYGVNFVAIPFPKKYNNITQDYFDGNENYNEGNKTFMDTSIVIKSQPVDLPNARRYTPGQITVEI